MFCPKCGAEYWEGFYKCADCGTDLVAGQPPEAEDEVRYVEMVEVFSTYNQGDIAFIKSVLDGEDIHYYFQGESTLMMVAAGSYARLLVQDDQAGRVRDILEEMGFIQPLCALY
ncbi:MAG: DUF2007 domain-containing protein [Smithellaceae bacterium]|nr:DUF2007 domain-containing protein [Smithellaceae bacterium]